MELFKVICVTCQAKLSVRNEGLIGQIVACPRCESMVEVARPAASAATTDDEPLAASAGGSSIAITAHQVEELSEAVAALTPADTTPTGEAPFEEPVAPTAEAEAMPAKAMTAEAMPAEAMQATEAVARYKLITWSIASFVVGATLVGAVVYRSTRPQDQTAVTPAVTEPLALPNKREPDEPKPIAPQADAPDEATGYDLQATTPVPIDLDSKSEEIAVSPESKPVPADLEVSPITSPKTETPAQPPEQPAKSPVLTNEPAARLARRFDPLEVDLESLSLSSAGVSEPETRATEIPIETGPIETGPIETGPIETGAIDAKPPRPAEATPEPQPEPQPVPRQAVQLGTLGENKTASRDAAQQLELMSPTVVADQLALIDALNLFSDLCGQPVSVAPDQLLMAGVTPQKKVSLQVDDMPLGEALQQLLGPLRLEYATDGPLVTVHRKEANKLRTIEYPIEDLTSADQNEKVFAGWIEQLVAPASWQSAGGNGTLEASSGKLKITQPQHVQYEVLILLERLRLARRLPPKSRYPVQRLAGTPAALPIADRLDRSTTFTFSQFTALEEVFAYWQEKAELPLLIDWPALAQTNLWPTSSIKAAVIDEPWHAALSNVLQPIGLDWRAATGGAIEITTIAKVQNELQLEIYPVQSSLDINKLRSLTKEDSGVLLYDPDGNGVLSLQPAATQRLIVDAIEKKEKKVSGTFLGPSSGADTAF